MAVLKINVKFVIPITSLQNFFHIILIIPFMKPIITSFAFARLTKVFILVATLLFTFQLFTSFASNYLDESDILKINPEYKIKRYANGKVIAYASQNNGEKIVHDFTDFNADILLAALRKQRISSVMINLSRKYGLSEDECRRKIKHSINVLEEWEIIIQPD